MVQPNTMDRAPATAEPMAQAGITREGSSAAKGMAPSVMKLSPMIKLVTEEFRSCAVNFLGNSRQATAMARGGTMPPIITEAIKGEDTACPSAPAREAVPNT